MAGNIPGTKYSTADFLTKFGNIAQTSQYRAHIVFPPAVRAELNASKIDTTLLNEIGVLCKATSLPGSSLATHDVANDFYGVTQKHAYRRQYDNTIDLTFFIDKDYQTLYTFEGWMEYIMPLMGQNVKGGNSYFTAQYPDSYRTEIYLHKFNKDHDGVDGFAENGRAVKYDYGNPGEIVYTFLGAFPQNISSAVVSYDPSSNLEFTVTFAYERYITDKTGIMMPKISAPDGGGSQPTLSAPKDNPSRPGGWKRWAAGLGDTLTGNRFDLDKRGTMADGAGRLKNNMINKSIDILHGQKTEATKGQNTSRSTQQLRDARDGVGSNTSVAASVKSSK
jgi:hypothetical protein